MGSGKSTIARLLAQQLQIPVLDLDECIEKKEQMSIHSIFENKGEIYFRKSEHEVFKELMAFSNEFVLSLGGGTPCYANNHELLRGESVVSFYLKVPVEVLTERLQQEKQSRPLIAAKEGQELQDFIAQHLFERSYYYHKATHVIDAGEKAQEEIVAEIESYLI